MIKPKTFRLYLLAFLFLGAIVGVVCDINAVFPQLSNEAFGSIMEEVAFSPESIG
jgi:hypothetical protein